MRLHFKQRLFSWFDSYDIYDEEDRTTFTVEGKLAWGHKLVIYDGAGREVGMVREKIIDLLPHFDLYKDGQKVGTLSKKISILQPKFKVDFNGWEIKGDIMQWNYSIHDRSGRTVARMYKKLLRLVDTYVIDVADDADALDALMVVLAIDAEKCSERHKEEKREAKALKAEAKASKMK